MDISIFGNLSIVGIFIPLFFALYLFISRLMLSYVDKRILNWGCSIFNFISLILFVLSNYFALDKTQIAKFEFNFFQIEKLSLDFGFLIDDTNILYLIIISLVCLALSIYSKFYFDKKKQFIFTKQRFYIFLSTLSFLSYFFIASINLVQSVVALFAQSVAVLVFAYFDIFKNPTNHNITRFHRISCIGNFALLTAVLILFKYAILSQGYIQSISLNFDELDILISYTFGISASFEFYIIGICLILAVMSRLMVFPLSCYYSFFANSSNIIYLTSSTLVNNFVGLYLFLKILPLLELSKHLIIYFEIFIALGIIISLIQILFERNVKIIFGYLLSAINSIFILLFLNFNQGFVLLAYLFVNLVFTAILMILFYKDKTNFSKRLINKQMGFVLEKVHIILFETLLGKISKLFDIINEKVIQNITYLLIKMFNYFASIFVMKSIKTDVVVNVRNILVIFAIFALVAIFVALFGGFNVK